MTFDHPRITIRGHHPLGARTRYLLLTLLALPLVALLRDTRPHEKADVWRHGWNELRGLP